MNMQIAVIIMTNLSLINTTNAMKSMASNSKDCKQKTERTQKQEKLVCIKIGRKCRLIQTRTEQINDHMRIIH